jgi:hypothetical protein
MSDFLTSLIGRARGTLEVVQPRVPSLYEPYRRGSGLLGAQPGLRPRYASSEPAVETGSGDDVNATPASHQAQELAARRVLPVRNAQTERGIETGSEGDVKAAPIAPQAQELAARPVLPRRNAQTKPAVETNSEGGVNAAPISHPTQETDARPVLPRRNAQTEPAVQTGSEDDVNAAPINYGTHRLRTHAARATPREGQSADHELDFEPAERFEPPHSSGDAQAPFIPRVVARPEQITAIEVPTGHHRATELNALPITRHTFQPSLPTRRAQTAETDSIAVPPSDTREGKPEGVRPLPASQAVTKRGLVRDPRSLEIETEPSSPSLDFRRSAEQRTSAEPHLVAQPLSPATGVVRPVEWPSLQARPAPSVTGAVRPPLAPRSGGARNPEALPPSSSPKPNIQVSIGRVEVRAVFPEPAVRRAQPRSSRPTVSLDDYLNRRPRGRR